MKQFLIFALLLISEFACAQQITGLWTVTEVRVGEEKMTPVAKWFRYNENGTYESGNGWLQNDQGRWTYDRKSGVFTPVTSIGMKDPYDGFKVSFEAQKMTWERMEDGMMVTVLLEPAVSLPRSTADLLTGLWALEEITESDRNITKDHDPEGRYNIFFRWDRIYREQGTDGKRRSGYWHMHGHRPEVTMLPHQDGLSAESWKVEITDGQLVLSGISDTNREKTMKFKRLDAFPG